MLIMIFMYVFGPYTGVRFLVYLFFSFVFLKISFIALIHVLALFVVFIVCLCWLFVV